MNKKYKIIVSVLAIAILVVLCYRLFHNSLAGANPAGTTNSSPRSAQIVCNNTATTTYASLLNSDANDRVVVGFQFFFTGYATATPFAALGAGTSSNAVATSTTNLFFNSAISTTTDPVYLSASQVSTAFSSTTNTGTVNLIASDAARVWTAGSYLNFKANATSTGYCTVKVDYLPE